MDSNNVSTQELAKAVQRIERSLADNAGQMERLIDRLEKLVEASGISGEHDPANYEYMDDMLARSGPIRD